MFRLEALVDDKNLATVMRQLAGKVHDLQATPVAEVRGATAGDDVPTLLATWMKVNGNKSVVAGTMKLFLTEVGLPQSSYAHYIKQAIKAGVLRKVAGTTGKGMAYSLVKNGGKS